ncbi:MAG TPA: TRAP transporter fused permease subunit, partial [Limnochordales bacterium]
MTGKSGAAGGLLALAPRLLALAAGVHQLWVAAFGASSTLSLRVTHWLLLGSLAYLTHPVGKDRRVRVWDLAMAAAAAVPSAYVLATEASRGFGLGVPSPLEMGLAALLVVTVLEATRRTAGRGLALVAVAFLAYGLFGHLIPGYLGHRPYSLARLTSFLYLSADGIYGPILGVSAAFILLFIVFGSVLSVSGAGELFINVALRLTGHLRGGAAKAGIFASALMGMITGSPAANVLTTGPYTIPLMVRTGYRPEEAAAIAAAAGVGSMVMPPVMAAVAFIMADYLGVEYSRVAGAALLPAVLFYVSLYLTVHLRAHKRALEVLPRSQLPDVAASLRARWPVLLSPALLIFGLVRGWSAAHAAFWAIVLLVAVMGLMPDRRTAVQRLLQGMEEGARSAVPVATATAVAGILVGITNLTGLGVKFSSFMVDVAAGNQLVLLLGIAVASLILGLGMPPSASYILVATLGAPALVKAGFDELAAHMFVLYFAVIGDITPPVALSAYAAAGIAGCNPDRAGWQAFRMGMVGYLV